MFISPTAAKKTHLKGHATSADGEGHGAEHTEVGNPQCKVNGCVVAMGEPALERQRAWGGSGEGFGLQGSEKLKLTPTKEELHHRHRPSLAEGE